MNSNKNKLILNDRLDQIFASDFKNDSHDSFDFINIDFILLNDIYIQITENVLVKIILNTDFLILQTPQIKISIKYKEISNFSIQEANNVHK